MTIDIVSGVETIPSSKVVSLGGLLQGAGGSRQDVLLAGNSLVGPVVRVDGTLFEKDVPPNSGLEAFAESALIENLIIDGDNQPGVTTGILLQNVCQCLIRNVTIRNCEVGIHIRDYEGLWSEGNTLKHIRMENVKKGIVFTTTGPYDDGQVTWPGNSAAFTTIEDVDIELANVSSAVGIQIGGKQITNKTYPLLNDSDAIVQLASGNYLSFVDPYSSHLKATVRLGSQGGTGLKVLNGFLHFAQAHLTVIGDSNGSGKGIDLHEAHTIKSTIKSVFGSSIYPPEGLFDAFIFYSQFSKINSSNVLVSPGGFMLVTSNILPQNRLFRALDDFTKCDVEVKSLT
jgi:hypothetical protein